MSLIFLSDLLAGGRPDNHCIAILEGRAVELGRLRADVSRNADILAIKRIRRGAVVCESGYWFTVGILALAKIGADVILPPNAQPGTLRTIAEEVDTILTDTRSADDAKSMLLESGEEVVAPFAANFGQSRLYFFTSGSTGEMKRVEKSLTSFELEALVLEQMWGAQLGKVAVVGTVTHQHVFGMTFRIMWPIVSGRPFHAEFHIAWEPLIGELNKPSMIVTSPAQLTRLGGLESEKVAVDPEIIITAGAPLPISAANDTLAIFGRAPIEILGSTEAGVIAWRQSGSEPVYWEPLPTVELRCNADGVMMLRSPHGSGSAWCEQADRISFVGGGCFRLEGRRDRVAKIEGKRVSLHRLENEIASLRWVSDAAVVSLGGEHRAYLGAVVRLSDDGIQELKRLGKFRFERILRKELSAAEDPAVLPRRWRFVDLMPMDRLGKRRVTDVVALLEGAS